MHTHEIVKQETRFYFAVLLKNWWFTWEILVNYFKPNMYSFNYCNFAAWGFAFINLHSGKFVLICWSGTHLITIEFTPNNPGVFTFQKKWNGVKSFEKYCNFFRFLFFQRRHISKKETYEKALQKRENILCLFFWLTCYKKDYICERRYWLPIFQIPSCNVKFLVTS